MINHERLLNEFLELVQIDSETKCEGQIQKVLEGKLRQLGFELVVDNASEVTGHEGNNIVATLKGTVDGPALLFTAHMDTVAPGIGVKPQIDGGYIRSDGSTILGSDDKAGLAAILEGVRSIINNGQDYPTLQLVFTIGEESGLVGAKALNPELLQADYGFAFDSTGKVGTIIVSAPTQAKINAVIYGRAAHAGVNPEDGISAIQVASKAISKMKLGRIDEETTANIGRFEGGGATNIVCDKVTIFAEARSLVAEKMEKQTSAMQEAFEQTAKEYGSHAEVEVQIMYPGYKFTSEDKVVQLAAEAVKNIGRTPELQSSGGGSDANVFAGFGIPTINLAIGYEQIHTVNERIPITELNKAAELVYAIITQAIKN